MSNHAKYITHFTITSPDKFTVDPPGYISLTFTKLTFIIHPVEKTVFVEQDNNSNKNQERSHCNLSKLTTRG